MSDKKESSFVKTSINDDSELSNNEISNEETSINDEDSSDEDILDNDCDYNNIENNDDDDINKRTELIGNKRITNNILTKYEYVRLLEDRTKQIDVGSKPMIKHTDGMSSIEIAKLEIETTVLVRLMKFLHLCSLL